MPVKRRAVKARTPKITPAAVDAFRQMEAAEMHEEWIAAHNILHDALALPPWGYYAIEYPDAVCPYPPGSFAEERWHKERAGRPQAFELYYD